MTSEEIGSIIFRYFLTVSDTYFRIVSNIYLLTFKRQPHKMVKHAKTSRRQQPTNCLSVFDHFVGLALKGLSFILTTASHGNMTPWIKGVIYCHRIINLHIIIHDFQLGVIQKLCMRACVRIRGSQYVNVQKFCVT